MRVNENSETQRCSVECNGADQLKVYNFLCFICFISFSVRRRNTDCVRSRVFPTKHSSNESLLANLCFICHKSRSKTGQSSFLVAHCFPGSQKVKDLPGVGWSLGHKLQTLGVETCSDLEKFSSQALQREFGPKTGLQLYQYCRGIDDRTLKTERERKSVSAEINYGIRFTKVRLISQERVFF